MRFVGAADLHLSPACRPPGRDASSRADHRRSRQIGASERHPDRLVDRRGSSEPDRVVLRPWRHPWQRRDQRIRRCILQRSHARCAHGRLCGTDRGHVRRGRGLRGKDGCQLVDPHEARGRRVGKPDVRLLQGRAGSPLWHHRHFGWRQPHSGAQERRYGGVVGQCGLRHSPPSRTERRDGDLRGLFAQPRAQEQRDRREVGHRRGYAPVASEHPEDLGRQQPEHRGDHLGVARRMGGFGDESGAVGYSNRGVRPLHRRGRRAKSRSGASAERDGRRLGRQHLRSDHGSGRPHERRGGGGRLQRQHRAQE